MTHSRVIYILIAVLLILNNFSVSIYATNENTNEQVDLLGYVNSDGNLMRYNPQTRTEELITNDVLSFSLARDGRVAYTRADSDYDLYIINPETNDLLSINFDDDSTDIYPISWSPDGQYLAVTVNKPNDMLTYYLAHYRYLYLWDGEQFINIMPDDNLTGGQRFYPEWRSDNLLAFQVDYTYSGEPQPDLFLWNGETTVPIIENPEGYDGYPRWSDEGQLLFYSRIDEEYQIYIWDGVTYTDGRPDQESFIALPRDLRPNNPVWVNTQENVIAFSSSRHTDDDWTSEIIWWDITEETILQRHDMADTRGIDRLAPNTDFVFASWLASGAPSYFLLIENLQGENLLDTIVGEMAWSSDGYLAYCGLSSNGRVQRLTLWDGEDSWLIDIVSYQPARWQNGHYTFSCNNG